MQYILHTPLTKADLAPLKAGDTVLLSGVVYTARDAAHARMMELLDKGEPLPFPIEGAAVYYVGPSGAQATKIESTSRPGMTTETKKPVSQAAEAVNPEAVKQSVVKNSAVYLAAIGGAGALMAGSVQSCEVIAWPDLGCEAVRKLVVKDFPLTVLLDTHGGDLYQSGPAAYLASRDHQA